jgi:hypothetical protein
MRTTVGYTQKRLGFTQEQKNLTERMVRSIGYDPEERVYFIDRTLNNIPFKLKSIYYNDLLHYVYGKMMRRHFGCFKDIETGLVSSHKESKALKKRKAG